MPQPLATSDDVSDGWRSLTDDEVPRVDRWCAIASAKLRQACPFDIDARIALFNAGSTLATALDPLIVTDVVVNIVKRYMTNINGVATGSESNGLVTLTSTYVNRYDKTGSDVRGAIQVTDSDIDQLRPAVRTRIPQLIELRPTRQMSPSSQWTYNRWLNINPITGLPDASYEGYYSPDEYDPSYEPDPTETVPPTS